MKQSFIRYILVIFIGGIFGFSLSVGFYSVQAIVWPVIRGNEGVNSVNGSLQSIYDKILINTGMIGSGMAKNTANLGGFTLAYYQRRIMNDSSTCIDDSTPVVQIAADGTATCRSTIPAICGSASGGLFTTMPSTDLCGSGSIASAVTDEGAGGGNTNIGPYTWTCTRGTVVNCRADSQGQCNRAFAGRCNSGMPTNFFGTIPPPSTQCGPVQTFKWWNCNGSNGANDMCQECY